MIVTDPAGRYDPGRPRRWHVYFLGGWKADPVIVRSHAIPDPDEELTEDPPSHELTWAEWAELHERDYGLPLDGQPVGGAP